MTTSEGGTRAQAAQGQGARGKARAQGARVQGGTARPTPGQDEDILALEDGPLGGIGTGTEVVVQYPFPDCTLFPRPKKLDSRLNRLKY